MGLDGSEPPRTEPAPAAIADTLLVVAVALALRAVFVAETWQLAPFRTPVPGLDVDLHWQAARMLRAGAPVQLEWMMLSAPVHPLLLAVEQALFGESMARLRLLSAVLGALTWGGLHRVLLARTGSRLAAVIVGLFAATLPALVYFDATLFKASFELTCLVAVVALALLAEREAGAMRLAAMGAGIGLCLATLSLSQRNALVLSVLVLVQLWSLGAISWHRRVALALPASAVLITVLFAFAQRSQFDGPLRFACLPLGGIHLRVGLQPGATGLYASVPGVPAMPYGHAFVGRMLAEVEEGRPLTPAQADAHHRERALLWLRHEPLGAAWLTLRKAGLFLSNYEIRDNDSLSALKARFLALSAPLGWGAVEVLAALGVLRLATLRRRRALSLPGAILLGSFLVGIAGFVNARYRLHALVPLLVLAADGVCLIVERARAGLDGALARRWAAPGALALAVGLFAFLPVGVVASRGLDDGAESERLAEQASILVGELDAIQGNHRDAELERAMRLSLLHHDTEAFAKLDALGHRVEELRRPDALRLWVTYRLWLGDYKGVGTLLRDLRARDPGLFESVGRHHPVVEQTVIDRLILNGAQSAQVLR